MTPAPIATANATPRATISLGPDGDLGSLIPTEVAGNAMIIQRPDDPWLAFAQATGMERAQAMLDKLGASPGDVSLVGAVSDAEFSSDNPQFLDINVFRVEGVDGNTLIAEMVPAILEGITYMVATTATVGGREMTMMVPGTPATRRALGTSGPSVTSCSTSPATLTSGSTRR